MGDPALRARIGLDAPLVGFLTTATAAASGSAHSLTGTSDPRVEPELALHLPAGGPALEGALIGPALELVDLDRPLEPLAETIATNVFHRLICLGPTVPLAPLLGDEVELQVQIDGERRRSAAGVVEPAHLEELLAAVVAAAEVTGARVEPGQAVICGSLCEPVAVGAGDRLEARFGSGLASLSLSFT